MRELYSGTFRFLNTHFLLNQFTNSEFVKGNLNLAFEKLNDRQFSEKAQFFKIRFLSQVVKVEIQFLKNLASKLP